MTTRIAKTALRCLWLASLTLTAPPAHAQSPDDTELASLNQQFGDLYAAGQYRQAIAVVERALAIRKHQVGDAHQDVGNLLVNLGELHRLAGDVQQAEPYFVQALAVLEKGQNPAMVATVLNNLGALRLQLGDPAAAEPYLTRALTVLEAAVGKAHPDVATARLNLAQVLGTQGKYRQAEQLDRQALASIEAARGPNHPQTALALNNLAGVLLQQADFAQSVPLLQRVVQIHSQPGAEKSADLGVALNNLAEAWAARGRPDEARPLYEKALAILVGLVGDKHPHVLQVQANHAVLLGQLGDFGRARAMHEHVLAGREAAFGAQHPSVAESCNALALLDLRDGDAETARTRLERALAIRSKVLGAGHALTAQTENNLGSALRAAGDVAGAQKNYQLARDHWTQALGPAHPDVANAWNNLGMLAHGAGDWAAARKAHGEALRIRQAALGEAHPLVASSRANLGGALQAAGQTAEAVQMLAVAMAGREAHLQRVLATGTESQRSHALLSEAADIHRVVSLHLRDRPNDPAALELALTVVLQRKARGVDAAAESTAALRQHLSAENRQMLEHLQDVTARIGALFQKVRAQPQLQEELDSAHLQADGLEQRLAASTPALREMMGTVTVARVQAAIPDKTALVELVAWLPFDVKAKAGTEPVGARRYAAYVLGKQGKARAVDLGDAATIDALAGKWRAALAAPERADGNDLARQMDAKIWMPIEGLLPADLTTVLLAPDGALHLVPLGATRDETGHWRLERWQIQQLATGRGLLRLGPPAKETAQPRPAVVVASPDYGPGMGFAALPGTADEGRALVQLLPGSKLLTGAEASESALRALHGPSILHIATHGFFTTGEVGKSVNAIKNRGQQARGAAAMMDPEDLAPVGPDTQQTDSTWRSGLALAGANGAGKDADGLMTAGEVGLLDLQGTKLVVLSACETGLGAVAGAEGVVGLRRALTLAGAETQVMSLWKVDDAATRDLMQDFYAGMAKGLGRGAALRQAQLAMLKQPDRAAPFFWAAFVMTGEWRR